MASPKPPSSLTGSRVNDAKAALYTPLGGYVGFDSITSQIQKKFMKRGFQLNIMLVGESGLGKSTFVNTLFASHLLDSKGRTQAALPNRKTVNIEPVSHVLNENGVKLRLTVVDTPGYGDQVNNDRCWEPIISHIKDQHGAYLKKELTATRDRFMEDTRIHLCLFFISPTGHSLKPVDILVLQKLTEVVNVVPVIAKSDSLTISEKISFKRRIKQELDFHGINLYPYASIEDDEDDRALNKHIESLIPFSVVGSEIIIEDEGQQVRGRKTRWGNINIEDPNHSEFVHLRDFITKTHLQDLLEITHHKHYEKFRSHQILSYTSTNQQNQQQYQQQQQQYARPNRALSPTTPPKASPPVSSSHNFGN